MPILILELAAALAIFIAIIWLGRKADAVALHVREAYLRRKARRTWRRYQRAARARHRSGQWLDDHRPGLGGDVVDADFEEVRR
jgi:hypothetical protein